MAIPDQIPERALTLVEAGGTAAIATVVRTWGSAPRPVGAQLVIAGDMTFEGSVSGGCVESAVIFEAMEAMETGTCRVLSFGVSDETAFEVGLACGGEIQVMVEPVGTGDGVPMDLLRDLVAARAARRPVIYEVDVDSWTRRLVARDGADDMLETRFRTDRSALEGTLFQGVHNPPLRMAVIGAVHIAQPLLTMAELAGYDVVLSDPRDSFATPERFPGATFLEGWPDEALADWAPDLRSAVVTLSHDPKIDTPALVTALASEAFYVGALGSKRTHVKRVAALQEHGLGAADIARIHAPVGLDIGAATPVEIALSIMAEITERLRRPETRP